MTGCELHTAKSGQLTFIADEKQHGDAHKVKDAQ